MDTVFPIDPIFISWTAKKYNFKTNFIDLSANINQEVTKWTINKIKNFLRQIKKRKKF